MFNYIFMQNALLGILIVTPLLAIIGTVIVNNKMSFFSDAIGHSALTGVGIGSLFGIGIATNMSVAIFSAFLAIVITVLKAKQKENSDTIISIVSSISMAIGIVLLSANGSFANYTNYIIGDILSITKEEISTMFLTLIITCIIMYIIYNKLIIISINETLAKSRGVNVMLYEIIFSIIVAVVVAFAIKWVGILVINSLIIIPCASARNISKNMKQYLLFSIIISLVCGIIGLMLSYKFDASTGATIVIINGLVYLFSRIFANTNIKTK